MFIEIKGWSSDDYPSVKNQFILVNVNHIIRVYGPIDGDLDGARPHCAVEVFTCDPNEPSLFTVEESYRSLTARLLKLTHSSAHSI